MPLQDKTGYYVLQKTRLLKGFDKIAKRAVKYLQTHDTEDSVEIIISETRDNFIRIIPEIPYIGGKQNQFSAVMVINAWIISFFRVMRARGKTPEEVISICCRVAEDYMASMPRFIIWAARKFAFRKLIARKMQRQAIQSRKRQYPQDFVYEYIKGNGKHFDWALEFTECAVNKFYDAQRVEELKPYCNFFDVIYSGHFNMGIDASRTIGSGCRTCRLEYKKGRETLVPDRLKGILPVSKPRTS
jgi:hypothetical protein